MKRILITLAAGLFAVMAAHAQSDWRKLTLTPSQTQFHWNGWDIKINALTFSNSITKNKGSFMETEEVAESSSMFVRLSLTVKNISNKGQTFVPQSQLKLVIAGNEFDAEDLETRVLDYLKNVEPTMVKSRDCYFEIPIDQLSGPFDLQLVESRFFDTGEKASIAITVADATPVKRATGVIAQSPPPSGLLDQEKLVYSSREGWHVPHPGE
jgi:hypothetical protein